MRPGAPVTSALCPSCKRSNAAHRVACLYCGVELPEPTEPPPPRAPAALPRDLDRLVRQAMSSGDTRRLREAMAQAATAEREVPPADVPSNPPVPDDPARSGLTDESRVLLEGLRRSASAPPRMPEDLLGDTVVPDDLPPPSSRRAPARSATPAGGSLPAELADLETAWELVRRAAEHDDRRGLIAALAHLASEAVLSAGALEAPLPRETTDEIARPGPASPPAAEEPATAEVELPPFRQSHALVVAGLADDSRTPEVARALGVDGVTARMIALSSAPRVAARSSEPEALEAQASAWRVRIGLPACVVSREDLAALAPPLTVLGAEAPWRLRLHPGAWWREAAQARGLPEGAVHEVGDVRLVVPGEVVLKHHRVSARGSRRDDGLAPTREERRGVVDLHGPGTFLRVVEGLTRFDGLPGHVPSSARRSVRALPQGLVDWYPQALLVEPRTVQPVREARAPEGAEAGQAVVVDGWAAWEEHTRMCRLLFEVGG